MDGPPKSVPMSLHNIMSFSMFKTYTVRCLKLYTFTSTFRDQKVILFPRMWGSTAPTDFSKHEDDVLSSAEKLNFSLKTVCWFWYTMSSISCSMTESQSKGHLFMEFGMFCYYECKGKILSAKGIFCLLSVQSHWCYKITDQ